MNTHEACNILGVAVGASSEEVKKAFKKKAVEFHPDRNTAPDAEQKFKEINEAFQLLEKYGTNPPNPANVSSDFYNHQDDFADELRRRMEEMFGGAMGFNPFGRPNQMRSEPIIVPVEVPFETAVTGGRKEINYERTVKCDACNDGKISVGNKVMCQKCGGHGYRKYGSEDKELPCTTCNASGYTKSETQCTECSGAGTKKRVDSVRITIPPGVQTGVRLILKGKGNYRKGGIYDNVITPISVIPDHDMQISGNDVISVVELSLLEALKGTKKKLRTVKGDKTLAFKPKTKHRDTVRVAGFGVPPHGAHTFIVNVTYPDDVDDIINALEEKDEPEPEEISGVQE